MKNKLVSAQLAATILLLLLFARAGMQWLMQRPFSGEFKNLLGVVTVVWFSTILLRHNGDDDWAGQF